MQSAILLIDDDVEELAIFNLALEAAGIERLVVWAGSAEVAFRMLRQLLPGFIFLDINMPKINGLGCLAELRTMEQLRTTPIILYSTYISAETRQKAFAMGASQCIEKPTTSPALSAQLKAILGTVVSG